MDNVIKVKIKSHYGRQHFYPSCDTSRSLAELCETKTLNTEKLKLITKMGFNVELVTENLPNFK